MLGLAPIPAPSASSWAGRRLAAFAAAGARASPATISNAANVVMHVALFPRASRWVVIKLSLLNGSGKSRAHSRARLRRVNPEWGSARPLQKGEDADRPCQDQSHAMAAKLVRAQRQEAYEDGARQTRRRAGGRRASAAGARAARGSGWRVRRSATALPSRARLPPRPGPAVLQPAGERRLHGAEGENCLHVL